MLWMIYGEKRLLLILCFLQAKKNCSRKSFWCENKLLSPGVGICEKKFSQRFLSFLFVSFIIGRRSLSFTFYIVMHSATFFAVVSGPTREKRSRKKQTLYTERSSWGWSMGVGWVSGVGGFGLERESFEGQSTKSKFIYSVS